MAFSLNDLNYEKDSKERMPWEHYTQEFAAADPKEIASRLSIPYDEETQKLTLTFPYEPWHLRYVGLPHSQIIMDEYLTLEEYIDLLEPGSFYQYGSYLISHQNGRVIDAPSGWKQIGAICNIILDPLFIFAFHMGVKGAAVATILSQAVSAVWVFSFLNGKQTKLRIRKEYLKVQPQIILPVMGLGLASFVMNITESLINIAFNASLSKYGGDVAVGAMTILASIMQLQFMPVQVRF